MDPSIWIYWLICVGLLLFGVGVGALGVWMLARKRGRVDPSIATRRRIMAEVNRLSRKQEPFALILVEFRDLMGNDAAAIKREALDECHKILRIFCVHHLDPKTSGALRGTGYGGIIKNVKQTEAIAQKLIMAFMTPVHVNGKPCMARASVGIRSVYDFFLPAWKIFAQADMAVSSARENSWVNWTQEMEDEILNIMARENHTVGPEKTENESGQAMSDENG